MRRELKVVPFQLNAKSVETKADGVVSFSGYGSVFGTIDSYNDTITRGAFAATLAEWTAKGKFPAMLLQHGGGYMGGSAEDLIPVGIWSEMREDDHGLFCAGSLLSCDTDRFRHIGAAIRSTPPALDGLSIGFLTRKYSIDEATDVRTLIEIALFEVSLVTFPANDPARLSNIKNAGGDLPTERELERILRRDVGLSRSQAKSFIAEGYGGLRDANPNASPTVADIRSLLASVEAGRELMTT